MTRRLGLALLAALVFARCLDFDGAYHQVLMRLDGGVDAGVQDAGNVDGGDVDGGDVDAGGVDAGDVDAGGVDAGPVDAGEVDAGPTDAGEVDAGDADAGTCGPIALRLERFILNDAGLYALVGGGGSRDEVVLYGPAPGGGGNYALALDAGWVVPVPDDVIYAYGADAQRVFGIGLTSTLLVEDGGVSAVDVCDAGPAASVTASTSDEAYFCTGDLGLCRWRPDGSVPLAPGRDGTCTSIAVLLDGTVVRGGATRTDGGTARGVLLWPDGGATPTAPGISNVTAIGGASERDYDFLSHVGIIHAVRSGTVTSTDAGPFYDLATVDRCVRVAVGTDKNVWTWDGTTWGPATWENDAGPTDADALNFVRVSADGTLYLGAKRGSLGGVYRVRVVPRP